MITERCIQNIKQIMADHEAENSTQLFSHDDIVTWFKQNRDKSIQLSIDNRDSYKIKTLLWNLNNLKVHIRSKFEIRLLHKLQNDSETKPYTPETLPESLTRHASSDEKEFIFDGEDTVQKTEVDNMIKPSHASLNRSEDWFDKMLDVVAAVVRGFMFNIA